MPALAWLLIVIALVGGGYYEGYKHTKDHYEVILKDQQIASDKVLAQAQADNNKLEKYNLTLSKNLEAENAKRNQEKDAASKRLAVTSADFKLRLAAALSRGCAKAPEATPPSGNNSPNPAADLSIPVGKFVDGLRQFARDSDTIRDQALICQAWVKEEQ